MPYGFTIVTTNKMQSEQLARDGFAVYPAVLTGDDVAQLRQQVVQHLSHGGRHRGLGDVQWNAASVVPAIEWVLYHPGITRIVNDLLGPQPVFTMHCDVHSNMASYWHKDSGEGAVAGGFFGSPQFALPDAPVLKVAIYCQDHDIGDRDGLHVKPGSHHVPALHGGATQRLYIRAGDVVIFDVRITHRGVSYSHALLRRAARVAHWNSSHADRVGAFFTFGRPGILTNTFSQRNLDRARQHTGTQLVVRQSLIDGMAAAGIALAPVV